ncbi:MAG: RluA family pseudouridine synthase [Isosphaeraceae bacterium]
MEAHPFQVSPVVLFEDAHVLALAKPAGMLTQGFAGGEPTLEDAARAHLGPENPGRVHLGTVHRLDRPVSGVVLWAKTAKAARRLAKQFEEGRTTKEYAAIVEVGPGAEVPGVGVETIWEDWLTEKTDARGVVRVVAPETPGARRALTRVRREAPPPGDWEGLAWLPLWPRTGRTHQLRAQASRRGLPVWGDVAYGSGRPFPVGIALHARSITFDHPTLARPTTIVCPWPDSWGLKE